MKNHILLYSALLIAATVLCSGQQTDTLTLKQSIEIALKNNPQVKIAEGNYESSEASYALAKAPLYPQVSFQSGWVNNGPNPIGSQIRPGYESYTAGFQGQMLLYDFGRTYNRVSAYEDIKNATESDLGGSRQNVVLSTEIAYYNYLQNRRVAEVANEVVRQAEEHVRRARGFFEVGKSPQYDVLKAETDLANARLNRITAESNVNISFLQLQNVMGVVLNNNTVVQDNLEVRQENIDLNQAVGTAMSKRPEIASRRYQVEASRSLVSSAWDANLPAIYANGGYSWRSTNINDPFQNLWNFGLNLSVPIFQGFAVDASVDQAEANLKISQANYDLTAQAVSLDVRQQYASLQQAGETIAATELLVRQAEETLRLAEGRYNQGVGSPIEVTDARLVYYNAQTSRIQSLYNYQTAFARLQRAMGNL